MALKDNLLAYYKLDETSSTTVYDSFGLNHGTNSGATINQSGKLGTAYSFDGINNEINIPHSSDFDVGNSWTISLWANANDWYTNQTGSGNSFLLFGKEYGSNKIPFAIGKDVDTSRLFTGYYDGNWRRVQLTSNPTTSSWVNLVGVRDSSSVSFYLNGTESVSNTFNTNSANNSEIVLIGQRWANDGFFDGKIDEIGIWGRALTSGEITQLYNGGDGLSYDNFGLQSKSVSDSISLSDSISISLSSQELVLGTNCGLVSSSPSANPSTASQFTIDNRIRAIRVTTTDAVTITEIGWWCDNATQESNFEVGIYSHDSLNNQPDELIYSDTTNAKGTDAGWKKVTGLNFSLEAATTYWIAVQVDNTSTATDIDTGGIGGEYSADASSQSSLPSDGSGITNNEDIYYAIYGLYTDDETLSQSMSDTISISDSLSINRNPKTFNQSIADSLNLDDSFSSGVTQMSYASGTDSISLTDTFYSDAIQSFAISKSDSIDLSDSVSAGIYAPSPEGATNKDTIYINNSGTWVEFPYFDYFRIKKIQNQMSEFEVQVFDISTAQKDYFKEQAEILFFCGENMILKGRIETIEYKSAYEVVAKGYGMEVKLLDKQFIVGGDNRVQYDNTSAQTIISTINSGILTTTSSGIWSSDFGNISMRYEYANRLNALGKTAEAIDYYWWVSQTNSNNYDIDYLNVASNQGETSSQKTFDLSNNASVIEQERDTSQLVNYIYALGYGDGINQLSTYVYAASTQSSFLSANIASTNTSIPVSNPSIFNNTGSVRIAKEIITYAGKSGSYLTGSTRGASSTTAKAHNQNCYIEQYFPTSSAQSQSSIDVYGIKEYTLIDKSIINEETLEVIASGYLSDHKEPIQIIKIQSDDPLIDASLNIGDNITITSSEANIDGSYRIVKQEFEDNYGFLTMKTEVSNRSLEFIEQMKKSKEEAENSAKYMQGATNIYSINESENCDESHPLNMKFYIPSDAVAINEVTLNFQLADFRAYNTANESESTHTHTITVGSEPGSGSLAVVGIAGSGLYSAFNTGSVASTESGSAHTHGISYGIYEETLTGPSLTLSAGQDGLESNVGTYTTSANSIDLSSYVTTSGWHNIKFEPNKRMRIEADAFVKIFIQSK